MKRGIIALILSGVFFTDGIYQALLTGNIIGAMFKAIVGVVLIVLGIKLIKKWGVNYGNIGKG